MLHVLSGVFYLKTLTVLLPAYGKAMSGLYVDLNLSFMICSCIKTKD